RSAEQRQSAGAREYLVRHGELRWFQWQQLCRLRLESTRWPPGNPGCLAYVTGTAHNNMVLTQDYFQASVSGDLVDLWAGTVEAAFGVDYRSDRFNYRADSSLNPAFNVMPSPIPPDIISPSYDLIGSTAGSMNVGEAFGELRVPLLS